MVTDSFQFRRQTLSVFIPVSLRIGIFRSNEWYGRQLGLWSCMLMLCSEGVKFVSLQFIMRTVSKKCGQYNLPPLTALVLFLNEEKMREVVDRIGRSRPFYCSFRNELTLIIRNESVRDARKLRMPISSA
jgi:hypothetical protein